MLVLMQRTPRRDAVYWPGRRWLAAVDAMVWPALWVTGVAAVPFRTGVVGTLVIALALVFALGRLRTALFSNQRYRFTTWRWGRPLVALVLFGELFKVVLTWTAA